MTAAARWLPSPRHLLRGRAGPVVSGLEGGLQLRVQKSKKETNLCHLTLNVVAVLGIRHLL